MDEHERATTLLLLTIGEAAVEQMGKLHKLAQDGGPNLEKVAHDLGQVEMQLGWAVCTLALMVSTNRAVYR